MKKKTLRLGHIAGRGLVLGKYTTLESARRRAREWQRTFYNDKTFRYGYGDGSDIILYMGDNGRFSQERP